MNQLVNQEIIHPERAIEIARKELARFEMKSEDSLAKFLPSQELSDVEYEIGIKERARVTAANWRMFDGATTSEHWGAKEVASGTMMPIARNYTLDERSRIRMRNDAEFQLERSAENLIARGARAIAESVNLQRANAIYNAKVEIYGSGGLRQTIDFGRKPEFDTVAPKLLSDPDVDIIPFLQDLVEMYEDVNGFRPAYMHLPRKILRLIAGTKKVRDAMYGPNFNPGSRIISRVDIESYFEDCELPAIYVTSRAKVLVDVLDDEAGPSGKKAGDVKEVFLFPQDSITFTPDAGDPSDPEASVFGRTFWGQSFSMELDEFKTTSDSLIGTPGLVAAVYNKGFPAQQEVIVDGLTMPVLFNPNYSLKAKVI